MTRISTGQNPLLISQLGTPNPFPVFRWQRQISQHAPPSQNLSLQERENVFEWGSHSILPYQVQDGYDRSQESGNIPVIFIENDYLKLTVYPQYGGRLASIYYKSEERELLFHNPVFQPANLAVLNAWFSGGIEWNGLIPGHTPFTCSPVFSAIVETARGPILRLYEFDRICEATWQIDLYLAPDDPKLWVHGKIINPNNHPVKCYWWTNMTTTLEDATRVFSPADYGIEHVLPDNHLEHFAFPGAHDYDGSYPANYDYAASVFYRKPAQKRPWITATHGDGKGLLQTSTAKLHSRKMFVFGNIPGGKRWMNFLSLPGQGDYIELQSGLMPTQNQEFIVEAEGVVEWTECIAPFALQDTIAREPDYHKACREVEAIIIGQIPDLELNQEDIWLREQSNTPPSEILHAGSAWGMLHEKMIGKSISPGLVFAKTPTTEVLWAELIETGTIPDMLLTDYPASWAVSERWQAVLQESAGEHGTTWLHELLLGVIALNQEQFQSAREHFDRSLQRKDSDIAYRHLALIAQHGRDYDEARRLYLKAWQHSEDSTPLAVEICQFYQKEEALQDMAAFISSLPSKVAQHERIRLAQGKIFLATGDFDKLRELLDGEFCTIRVGETLLTDLWFALHIKEAETHKGRPLSEEEQRDVLGKNPVPHKIDFRMVDV
jgi:tetratricopeptide (TPR) repeat protein